MLILTLLNGSHASHQHTIRGDQPQVLGRHGPDIRLDDSRISRRHAMIQRDGQRWLLIDLGSSNGTYLNDQRIPGPAELKPGDRIRMGRLLLEVDIEPTVVPTPLAGPAMADDEPLRLDLPLGEGKASVDVVEEPPAVPASMLEQEDSIPLKEQSAAPQEEDEEDEAPWDSGGPVEATILPPDESDMPPPSVDVDEQVVQAMESFVDPFDDASTDAQAQEEPDDQAAQLRQWVEQTSEPSETPEPSEVLLDVPDEVPESIPEFIDLAPAPDTSEADGHDDLEEEKEEESQPDVAESIEDLPILSQEPPATELLEQELVESESLDEVVAQDLAEDLPVAKDVLEPDEPTPVTVLDSPAPIEEVIPAALPKPIVTTPSQAMVPSHPPRRRPMVLLLGLLALALTGAGTWYVYPLLPFSLTGQAPLSQVVVIESSTLAQPDVISPPTPATLKTLQAHIPATPSPPQISAALVQIASDSTFDEGPLVIGRVALASRLASMSVPVTREEIVVAQEPRDLAPAATPLAALKSPIRLTLVPSSERPTSTPTAAAPQAAARTVYLVDASGSLIDTFSQVVAHLGKQIRQLSPDEQFAVIFFRQNDLIEVPPAGLKSASRPMIRQTLQWTSTESGHIWPQGRSNITKALALALSYHPTAICILSDNAINRRTADADPDAALQAIHTALSQVPPDAMPHIDTVQFVYKDPGNVLQQLAQAYQGQFLFIAPPLSSEELAHPLQTLLHATP